MHKFFISQYISRLTKEDVKQFAIKNNIYLNDQELDIIYQNLKEHWETVLYGNPTPLFKQLKTKLSTESYQKGITLYEYYHNLYKDYL
jgi:hypothetical protein